MFFAAALRYYPDVFLLIYHYRRPPREDMTLAVDAVSMLPFALIGHLWIGAWMMSAVFVFTYNENSWLGTYGVISSTLIDLLPAQAAAKVSAYANGAAATVLLATPELYSTAVGARGAIPYVLPAAVLGGVWLLLYCAYGINRLVIRPVVHTLWAVGILPLRSVILCCNHRCGLCAKCVPWASSSAEGEDTHEDKDKPASLASAPRLCIARCRAPRVDPKLARQRRHVLKWLTKDVASVVLADKLVEERLAGAGAPVVEVASALGYDPAREERWSKLWRSGDFVTSAALAVPPDASEHAGPCCSGFRHKRVMMEGDVSVDGTSRLVRAPLYSRAVALGLFAGSAETYAPLQNSAVSEALFAEMDNVYYRFHSSVMEPDILRLQALGKFRAWAPEEMALVRKERIERWAARMAEQRRAAADAAGFSQAAAAAAFLSSSGDEDETAPWTDRPQGQEGPAPPNPFADDEEAPPRRRTASRRRRGDSDPDEL